MSALRGIADIRKLYLLDFHSPWCIDWASFIDFWAAANCGSESLPSITLILNWPFTISSTTLASSPKSINGLFCSMTRRKSVVLRIRLERLHKIDVALLKPSGSRKLAPLELSKVGASINWTLLSSPLKSLRLPIETCWETAAFTRLH